MGYSINQQNVMNRTRLFIIAIFFLCISLAPTKNAYPTDSEALVPYRVITGIEDVLSCFPSTPIAIRKCTLESCALLEKGAMQLMKQARVISLETLLRRYDQLAVRVREVHAILTLLNFVSPDANVRAAAHEGSKTISKKVLEALFSPEFASIFYGREGEVNNEDEHHLLEALKRDFLIAGIGETINDSLRNRIAEINKEIITATSDFDHNIAGDTSAITVSREELAGLDDAFISQLPLIGENLYEVNCSHPIYYYVMAYCTARETRQRLYRAFSQRAYPQNVTLMQTFRERRADLARLLGFPSWAHLQISNEMAKNPHEVENFLHNMLQAAQKKCDRELLELHTNRPADVVLSNEGLIEPWDRIRMETVNKNKKLRSSLDYDFISTSEYFPLASTIEQLLSIYEKFLGIRFTRRNIDAWHETIQVIEINDAKDGRLLGIVLLDLHARPKKYSHARIVPIIQGMSMINQEGKRVERPSLTALICNFSAASPEMAALLGHGEVETFFHEFGHALHEALSKPCYALHAGISVDIDSLPIPGLGGKMDFIELPSQLLENWIWEPSILRTISSHYITEEPLPESQIQALIESRKCGCGLDIAWLIDKSLFSLNFYLEPTSDAFLLAHEVQKSCTSGIAVDEQTRYPSSFWHLPRYGPRYYSYLWSLVFSCDLFEKISQHGLLDPVIGMEYRTKILAPGGSRDPMLLLEDFLGRKPSSEAFLKAYGLK